MNKTFNLSMISGIVVMVLVVPQIAFAAWWNPFTWGIFSWLQKAPVQEEIVAPAATDTEVVVATTTQEVRHEPTPASPGVSTQTSNVAPPTSPKLPPVATPGVKFQISDLKNSVGEEQATVSWRTSLPSRSRLTLSSNGKVYESLNDVSTEHKVVIAVQKSVEYDYRITAKTLDASALEDDLYGSFTGPIELTAALGGLEDDCRTIIVKSTAGKLSTGTTITVRGLYKTVSATSYRPVVSATTNSDGEVEYCHKANVYEISGAGLNLTLP